MVLCIISLISTIQLLVKVDFVPLTPEEIERVEIQELKHRMEIGDLQRKEKEKIARKSISQNDFVPQQSMKTAPSNAGASPMNRMQTSKQPATRQVSMVSPVARQASGASGQSQAL